MEVILTTGEDLLALRQATVPPTKRYKSSARSAVSELANLQARQGCNPFTQTQKNLHNGRLEIYP